MFLIKLFQFAILVAFSYLFASWGGVIGCAFGIMFVVVVTRCDHELDDGVYEYLNKRACKKCGEEL